MGFEGAGRASAGTGRLARGLGIWVGVLGLAWGAPAIPGAVEPGAERRVIPPEVFTLENGLTVVFQRVPGASLVGIEEVHPVGLIHDPAGVTQASHLLEHLRCTGATPSHERGASFGLLNAMGMGNAETMGDLTHYDLVVPTAELELAVSIIGERLCGLVIDDALLAQEIPRCAAEVEHVSRAMGTPGFKFALAAGAQHWRHARTRVLLSRELSGWDAHDAATFHRATHRAGDMLVVVAGDLEPEDVEAVCRRVLGGLAGPVADEPVAGAGEARIDWGLVPRLGRVVWDDPSTGVLVAYPPPGDAEECLALTLWSAAALERLGTTLRRDFSHATLGGTSYPVRTLPLLAFAGADGEDPASDGVRLALLLEELAAEPGASLALARRYGSMMGEALESGPDPGELERARRVLEGRVGAARAESFVVGNLALQLALQWHSAGPMPRERLESVLARDDEWWRRVIGGCVAPERRIVTILGPAAE